MVVKLLLTSQHDDKSKRAKRFLSSTHKKIDYEEKSIFHQLSYKHLLLSQMILKYIYFIHIFMLNFIHYFHLKLRCDERFTHAFAFSKKLPWLAQTKVITLKTHLHAVNACVKRSSQRSLRPN